jgi:hypothetical protein
MQVHARSPQHRNQSEQDSGDERNEKREEQDAAVDADVVQSRNIGRAENAHRPNGRECDEDSRRAARQAEQHALGQQLPEDARAARADCRADRDFFLASRRARQQQVRDVRAGDQQHKPDRAQQNIERQPYVAHDLFEQRHDAQVRPPFAG